MWKHSGCVPVVVPPGIPVVHNCMKSGEDPPANFPGTYTTESLDKTRADVIFTVQNDNREVQEDWYQTQYINGFLGCLSPLFHAASLNWIVPEDEILLSP